MKGSLNLQVTYDTTRSPSGDRRYDFVTKVTGDPILDHLSLAERQAFDSGIAYQVNEMLAGAHRISIPKEEWVLIDVAVLIFEMSLRSEIPSVDYHPFNRPDWREFTYSDMDSVWAFIHRIITEIFGDELAKHFRFPDGKIKTIGNHFLRLIVKEYITRHRPIRVTEREEEVIESVISFMRKVTSKTPGMEMHSYESGIIKSLLTDLYSFTQDEMILLFDVHGKRSLACYFENFSYLTENQIFGIAQRAMIDPKIFLSQVIATAKVLESNNHERDQQQ